MVAFSAIGRDPSSPIQATPGQGLRFRFRTLGVALRPEAPGVGGVADMPFSGRSGAYVKNVCVAVF